jgi:hypothetical protein
MNARQRVPLGGVIRAVLPRMTEVAPGAGRGAWESAVGQAYWELEPDGDGFWLVLSGWLGQVDPLNGLFQASRRWAWPLKVACKEPGGRPSWCAETRLTGVSGDARLVARLAVGVDRWLMGVGGPSDGAVAEEPTAGSVELLERALGGALKRSARGYRLPVAGGPALTITAQRGFWVFRSMLVRPGLAVASPSLASLYDFMAVANGRVRGCRAVLDGTGDDTDTVAVAETRVPFEPLTVADVKAAAILLARAARLVSPACEVLVGQLPVGELYREVLIGDEAAWG